MKKVSASRWHGCTLGRPARLLDFIAGVLRRHGQLLPQRNHHVDAARIARRRRQPSEHRGSGQVAQKAMEEGPRGATRWCTSPPGERSPATQLGWSKPSQPGEKKRGRRGNFHSEKADPTTGEVLSKPRETRGGEFLYRLHFDLHYMPAIWARWIVGFCAMFMFVSIISGIVTHKRIFKDLFTFRPKKGQRSWLDAHNVTAVLALPYHIMITYTGLVTLMFLYMPSGAPRPLQGRQGCLLRRGVSRPLGPTASRRRGRAADGARAPRAPANSTGAAARRAHSVSHRATPTPPFRGRARAGATCHRHSHRWNRWRFPASCCRRWRRTAAPPPRKA